MKHYFNPVSRAITTDWMLAELGVPHEQIMVDLQKGENNTPAFRALNPMGKLPVLVDGDTVVTEVSAICAYLADKYPDKGLAPKADSPERATYFRYLFIAGNTLEPALALEAAGFEHPKPSSAAWGDASRAKATVEALVPAGGWVLGEQFTAADVVFGALLDAGMVFGWLHASPRVAAYVERLRARPTYQQTHKLG